MFREILISLVQIFLKLTVHAFTCFIVLYRYPYNNALHHHVESIVLSCLESKLDAIVDHLLRECDLIGKVLQADKNPVLSGDSNKVNGCYRTDG